MALYKLAKSSYSARETHNASDAVLKTSIRVEVRMDVNRLAYRVVEEATSDSSEKMKRAASRKGGLRGGVARAKAMTPEQRAEIARKANAVRWRDKA